MVDAREIIRRCRLLAEYTEEPWHITRTFLSPPMHEVHRLVRGWMEDAGLSVRVDAAGNIRGVRGEAPRMMIASHLDTVPHAGAFDGILGVMIGIALAHTGKPVEVVGFSEEEGVRFGVPFIGSRAMVGDPVMEPPVVEALHAFGLDPGRDDSDIGDSVSAYLEFHIEQGPVLDSAGLPLGIVEAIAGQSRYEVNFHGRANHAGTTPMNQRADALAAAAEWIGMVEQMAAGTQSLVATVGRLEVEPGALNVIPGAVRASLDVRSASNSTRREGARQMLGTAERIASRRGVSSSHAELLDQPATPMDERLVERLADAVTETGYPVHRMASGAGHDAMILARRVPVAMLFLRSPGGISHHPDEAVREEDVEAALKVGRRFL